MEKENKLHSIEISRVMWKVLFWALIIIGIIIFSISSSTFFIPKESQRAVYFVLIGGILIGSAFGLVYSRVFDIKGIDY